MPRLRGQVSQSSSSAAQARHSRWLPGSVGDPPTVSLRAAAATELPYSRFLFRSPNLECGNSVAASAPQRGHEAGEANVDLLRQIALLRGLRRGRQAAICCRIAIGSVFAWLAIRWLFGDGHGYLAILMLLGPLIGRANVALAVRVGARRARRASRALPPHAAAEVLRPLAKEGDETTRKIASRLLKELRPGGNEVVVAAAPEGRGSELADGGRGG